MKIEGDTITFSSGRTAYANNGIVGLGPKMSVTEGYDGGIGWPPLEPDEDSLTADDMGELADHMVAEWTRFKATLKSE